MGASSSSHFQGVVDGLFRAYGGGESNETVRMEGYAAGVEKLTHLCLMYASSKGFEWDPEDVIKQEYRDDDEDHDETETVICNRVKLVSREGESPSPPPGPWQNAVHILAKPRYVTLRFYDRLRIRRALDDGIRALFDDWCEDRELQKRDPALCDPSYMSPNYAIHFLVEHAACAAWRSFLSEFIEQYARDDGVLEDTLLSPVIDEEGGKEAEAGGSFDEDFAARTKRKRKGNIEVLSRQISTVRHIVLSCQDAFDKHDRSIRERLERNKVRQTPKPELQPEPETETEPVPTPELLPEPELEQGFKKFGEVARDKPELKPQSQVQVVQPDPKPELKAQTQASQGLKQELAQEIAQSKLYPKFKEIYDNQSSSKRNRGIRVNSKRVWNNILDVDENSLEEINYYFTMKRVVFKLKRVVSMIDVDQPDLLAEKNRILYKLDVIEAKVDE